MRKFIKNLTDSIFPATPAYPEILGINHFNIIVQYIHVKTGVTSKQFAKLLGMSTSTLYRIKNNETGITNSQFIKLMNLTCVISEPVLARTALLLYMKEYKELPLVLLDDNTINVITEVSLRSLGKD